MLTTLALGYLSGTLVGMGWARRDAYYCVVGLLGAVMGGLHMSGVVP